MAAALSFFSSLPLAGTLFNVVTVVVGGSIGMLLGNRLSESMRSMAFQGLGLCSLAIGMKMAFEMQNPLPVIFAVVGGGLLGVALKLEERMNGLGGWLKARIRSKNERFTEGLVTATLLYCVGPMAILGAFDEGLRADPTLLMTKAVLDGFSSIALASAYGFGIVCSALPVFLYQATLTLFATSLEPLLTETVVAQLTATGGVCILGIAVNLMELKYVPISNLLPALPLVVLLTSLI